MAKKKILIVDDELMLLMSMQRMLGDEYDVTIATGSAEALNTLKKDENFNLIICDIFMPEMNGIEFYNKVATLYPALKNRFIFMTGAALTQKHETFFKNNKNPCLSKPFEYDKFINTVEDFLA